MREGGGKKASCTERRHGGECKVAESKPLSPIDSALLNVYQSQQCGGEEGAGHLTE